MPARPGWYKENWRRMDKDTARKMRTTCPKCGSERTYYNEKFKVWRCAVCEHTFTVKGVRAGTPWWKKLFKKYPKE